MDDREDIYNIFGNFGSKLKTLTRSSIGIAASSPKKEDRRTSRRATKMIRLGSFASFNMLSENKEKEIVSNKMNDPKEIAQKLSRLYNASIVTFLS